MTSDRPYRPAMPLAKALDEVRGQVGRQFCPTVVAALDASLQADPAGWQRLGDAGAGDALAA
jgi:HD-GYP domain-containing protein (c-di-GMP phosphodiesterase class II)